MEEGEIILGRVKLNAFHVKDKEHERVTPVIELLGGGDSHNGQIVALKVVRASKWE